jgi:hypothetical protein
MSSALTSKVANALYVILATELCLNLQTCLIFFFVQNAQTELWILKEHVKNLFKKLGKKLEAFRVFKDYNL